MAAMNSIDLDRIVDYRAEYTAVIEKHTISGDNLLGLCPFHKESNPSFSVDLKTGKWHCFTEDDGGNFVSFWAKYHGMDTKEAYKAILEKYGVKQEKPEPPPKSKSALESYTVEQYSQDKKLPEDFLRETCLASTGKKKDGTTYLKMPYAGPDGKTVVTRERYARKEFRWAYGAKGKICLYGEWRLAKIRQIGWAALVEGESDTQSLWYMGIPAIGVPGASTFKSSWTEKLHGLKLYVHKELDVGGETFTAKVYRGLKDGGFTGEIYEWQCAALGLKDPSDVYLKHGKEYGQKQISSLIAQAKSVSLDAVLMPDVIPGAPIRLRQPEGFIYSEKGISEINQKTMAPSLVCRTPIILTKRLKSLETGDERIEIAFKRDDRWHTAIYPRSTIFSSRKITELADLGCTVTSENARQVVKFLGALEAENIEVIPKNDATSTFGWQPDRRFLPGHDDGITLDIDPSQRGMAAAYCQNGTLERWVANMAPHRAREKFRFILAASFAAPLLRIVKQRIFFVYNWGDSKGGKAQPLDTRIITPTGSTTMGEIKIGDLVIGRDGKQHTVTDIFPQGIKDIYKISFSDGTSTKCCKEHLWMVSTRTRRNKGRGYTVMELKEMLKKPIRTTGGYNFNIPVCEAVEYSLNPKLKIPPYLLGALLGDGCMSGLPCGRLYFNNSENDVIQKVKDQLAEMGGRLRANPYTSNQFEITNVPTLKSAIVEYGINKRSEDKFIPQQYLMASIENRQELLAGLMDTDGTVDRYSGSFKYSTTSSRLADGIQELCRSLGYRTRKTIKARAEKRFPEIIIAIGTDDHIFTSKEHALRVPAHNRKTDKKTMAIINIEPAGREECQCIMLDSNDHTYLCDDYIVTHNTAALKAALSAWGDPERLMVNFNATQVGLERTAAFYCDLPLGIDERQLAGTKQESLEKIVYMIASGTGKIRGSKTGGIQTTYQWRTVALATGEEPLSTETSQTGVSTRVLEIYGGPFDNEQDAAMMHQRSAMDFGWAGPAFIEKILAMDERDIVEEYERMQSYVREISDGKNGSHISGIAAVALADSMIDQWFFGGTKDKAWEAAKAMAGSILINQVESNSTDVNENAVQFITDWVLSNKAYFGTNAIGTCLGFTTDNGNKAYIFPSMLNQALSKAGYSPRKTMKYMAEQGLVGTEVDKRTGKKVYSVRRTFESRLARFVEFRIGKLAENKDPIDDADELAEAKAQERYQQTSLADMDGFMPLDCADEDLPF